MAASKVTSIGEDAQPTRYFGQTTEVYTLKDGTQQGDLTDAIDMRLQQLIAATFVVYGEGHDSFSRMSDTIQDNYLWMVHSLASEISDLWEVMRDIMGPCHRSVDRQDTRGELQIIHMRGREIQVYRNTNPHPNGPWEYSIWHESGEGELDGLASTSDEAWEKATAYVLGVGNAGRQDA